MSIAIFKNLCPNCGRNISSGRLEKGLPCYLCLPESTENPCDYLEKENKLNGLRAFCFLIKQIEEFKIFFKEKTGFSPWALQEMWAKRVILGNSFAALAPTGIGKTTFGIIMSAFLDERSYIIVPTKALVQQIKDRLDSITDKNVLAYTGKKKERQQIESGDFEILVTTSMFLYKNFETLKDFKFSFIFVDDVDSLLKTSKNVDYLVKLLGFTDNEIEEALLSKQYRQTKKKPQGVLVVSSATAQPKTKRIKLFQNLLGFEVQKSISNIRNVVDTYISVASPEEGLKKLPELIKQLGDGGLVYISSDLGRKWIEKVKEKLKYQAISYDEKDAFKKFKSKEVKVLIGLSHQQNPLVRGIDMPERIRYAVFLGVPKILIPATVDSIVPSKLLKLILSLRIVLVKEQEKIENYLNFLNKYAHLKEDQLERYPSISKKLKEIADFIKEQLERKDIIEKTKSSDEVSLTYRDGELTIVIGDATSYIQATGRTSRLFAGGLTKGLAVSLVYDAKAFKSLERRLRRSMNLEIELQEFEKIDLESVTYEIDQDRERVRKILSGNFETEQKNLIKTTLVVVESPNKARTIAGFFAKPQKRWIGESLAYEVNLGDRVLVITASLGHIFDLVEKGGIYGVLEKNGKFIPVYSTIKRCSITGEQTTEDLCISGRRPDQDKITIVQALRELSMEVEEIFVATDPDSEGEKIAWDITLSLKPFNRNINRSEFHEVTPKAFKDSLSNPRKVNENMVKAQILRRIADRWIGFSLSEKLQSAFGMKSLSAGRVQTPVLGWIIKRDKERQKKVGLITVEIEALKISFKIEDTKKVKEIFEKLDKSKIKIEKGSIKTLFPSPPFNTGELLKAASSFASAQEAMAIAQELFEKGLITYHRTDSTRVSDAGFKVAEKYVSDKLGKEFLHLRRWQEGGAHECIRPTRAIPPDELGFIIKEGRISLDNPKRALKLYSIIWKKFIASQMKEARVEFYKLTISLNGEIVYEEELPIRIIENGFNLVSPIKTFSIPQDMNIKDKKLEFIPSIAPFTQGSLIEEMIQRGIGRPSTYAKIVQILLDRKYIAEKRRYLFPTALGKKVYAFLSSRYQEYTSEEFTRILEEIMDRVEENKADYQAVLKKLKETVFSIQ